MATIADQLNHINTTKGLIRDVIVAQGVTVPDTTPFRQYADKIAQIEGGGESSGETAAEWVRPAGRPDVPVLNDNEIYMLFGVSPTGPNDFAITLTCTGTTYYYANWGDGLITKDPVISGSMASNIYFYDELDIVPDADGIKWLWIKFYVSAGSFTGINLNVRPATRPSASASSIFVPQVYEIYMQAPNVSTFAFASNTYTKYRMTEIFKYYGTNLITSFYYFMTDWVNLKLLEIDTSRGTNFSYFLQSCYSFNGKLNIDTTQSINFSYFLTNCYAFNQPLNINTDRGMDFSNFMQSCYSFNQPLNINTSKATSFTSFMVNCYNFNQPLTLDVGSTTSISSFLSTCYNFNQQINLLNSSSLTNISSLLQNGYSFNQPLNLDTGNVTQFGNVFLNAWCFNQPLNLNTAKGQAFLNFMNGAGSFSHKLIIDLASATTAIGTGFISSQCRALTGLRLLNMGSIHTALTASYNSLTASALEDLFNDLYDRSATTAGTITITGAAGASALTAAQRLIATGKNWTIVG